MGRPFNWAQIESGATFHALVGVLLEAEDPDVVVFNREGPDGAVDAHSGNRHTVFQSKHHKNATWAQVIADAKAELTKIRDYRQPGHPWYPCWKDATKWTLVTNVALGTNDEARWENEVVPLFETVGLDAHFLHQPRIETKLLANPDLADAFFGGRTRLFLSLAEHREALSSQEMLRRAYQIPVEGRAQELERIRRFVTEEDQQVLLVHGPGGVGKSRLLVEAAERLSRETVVSKVHCATKHLAVSGDWYLGLVPETKALVLLDDPQDPDLIDRLLTELRSRAKLWKVIVAVQTPDEPVIHALTNPRERLLAPDLEVDPLLTGDATRYAHALLEPLAMSVEDRSRMAKWLVDVCGRFPVWMTVAVHLLETRGDLHDLPGDKFRIAQGHVSVVLDNTSERLGSRKDIEALLHWISLLQPFNRHANNGLEVLAREAGFKDAPALDRAIEDLIRRGVITAYGVGRRFIEIRPHVLRDFFRLDWLTYSATSGERRPSSDALSLARRLADQAEAEEPDPFTERIITALGRTELITKPRVAFLDAVADAAIKAAETAPDTKAQYRAVEFAKPLAPFRSREFTKIVNAIRTRLVPEVSNENPYFPHVISRASVVRDLPRGLLRAAMAATESAERRAVLQETIAWVDLQIGGATPRDLEGQAAAETLAKIVHCRHGFRSGFQPEVGIIAAEILDRIETSGEFRKSDQVLLKALLQVERHDAYVPQEDPSKLQLEDVRLNPAGPAGKNAVAVRERLWGLTTAVPGDSGKRFVWKLLDELHISLGRASEDATWKELWVDDLKRCHSLVTSAGIALVDVQLARAVWKWHATHEQDAHLKGIAQECEEAYLRHPIVARYAPVFAALWSSDRLQATVAELPSPLIVPDLDQYFDGALVFARTHSDDWRMNQVIQLASVLGAERGTEEGVRAFIAKHLGGDRRDDLFSVALAAAAERIRVTREGRDSAALSTALDATASYIGDGLGVAALIEVLYGRGISGRGFTRADYEFTLKRDSDFRKVPARQRFEALGRFLAIDGRAADRARDQAEFNTQDEIAVAMLWSGYFEGLPPRIRRKRHLEAGSGTPP